MRHTFFDMKYVAQYILNKRYITELKSLYDFTSDQLLKMTQPFTALLHPGTQSMT